jgi:hypothetical protein
MQIVALVSLVLAAILALAVGVRYLLTKAFMPYHAAVLGKSWAVLEPRLQTIILGMLRVAGAGPRVRPGAAVAVAAAVQGRSLGGLGGAHYLAGRCRAHSPRRRVAAPHRAEREDAHRSTLVVLVLVLVATAASLAR